MDSSELRTETASSKLSREDSKDFLDYECVYYDGKLKRDHLLQVRIPWITNKVDPVPLKTESNEDYEQAVQAFHKLSLLFLEFVECEIALTKKLVTYPGGKRGDRGFLISDSCLDLIDSRFKACLIDYREKYGSRVVFVNDAVIMLPVEFYRLVRK